MPPGTTIIPSASIIFLASFASISSVDKEVIRPSSTRIPNFLGPEAVTTVPPRINRSCIICLLSYLIY
jgi:hypothetical protein